LESFVVARVSMTGREVLINNLISRSVKHS
jgi:hypothetical protein